jgi:hypothetical protein
MLDDTNIAKAILFYFLSVYINCHGDGERYLVSFGVFWRQPTFVNDKKCVT